MTAEGTAEVFSKVPTHALRAAVRHQGRAEAVREEAMQKSPAIAASMNALSRDLERKAGHIASEFGIPAEHIGDMHLELEERADSQRRQGADALDVGTEYLVTGEKILERAQGALNPDEQKEDMRRQRSARKMAEHIVEEFHVDPDKPK